MERSIRPARSARAAIGVWLLLLLTAPLAVGGHVHLADHDGDTAHLESPHGDHEVQVLDQSERLPSTQFERSVFALPSAVQLPADVATVPHVGGATEAKAPPARGPPGQPRSRAPPHLI